MPTLVNAEYESRTHSWTKYLHQEVRTKGHVHWSTSS